jgi:hypothetical protein
MRPGRDADHSPPSSAEVLEEWSYTSTPFWATTGPITGLLYFNLPSIYVRYFKYFKIAPVSVNVLHNITVQKLRITNLLPATCQRPQYGI